MRRIEAMAISASRKLPNIPVRVLYAANALRIGRALLTEHSDDYRLTCDGVTQSFDSLTAALDAARILAGPVRQTTREGPRE